MASVANIQGGKNEITEEDIDTGINAIANFTFPHNAALKQ